MPHLDIASRVDDDGRNTADTRSVYETNIKYIRLRAPNSSHVSKYRFEVWRLSPILAFCDEN